VNLALQRLRRQGFVFCLPAAKWLSLFNLFASIWELNFLNL